MAHLLIKENNCARLFLNPSLNGLTNARTHARSHARTNERTHTSTQMQRGDVLTTVLLTPCGLDKKYRPMSKEVLGERAREREIEREREREGERESSQGKEVMMTKGFLSFHRKKISAIACLKDSVLM